MIIAKLNGGLGNQLFQYAAGYSLAIKNIDTLKIDVEAYQVGQNKKQIFRNLDIADFLISAAIASPDEINKTKNPWGYFSKIYRLIKQKILKIYYIDWHPEILKQEGDIYLDGYFQTEKYFIDYVDLIRKEFTLNSELYKTIKPIVEEIQGNPISVSLHIRRGDYVENPTVKKYHLVCDMGYYINAVSAMQNKFPNLMLYIFSDDPDWVKENLPVSVATTFISSGKSAPNSLKPSQELVLMSKCDHHIISNSSFSWWGAYLNESTGKIVLAPNLWNKGLTPQPNILPDSWTPFPIDHNGQ
jgi:hypothetical protein